MSDLQQSLKSTKPMNNNQTQPTNQIKSKRFRLKTWQWLSVLIIAAAIVLAVGLVSVGSRIYQTELATLRISSKPPPSQTWLFERSDIISYVEVLEVDKAIELPPSSPENMKPGEIARYPKQFAKVKFLKLLKGSKELENTTRNIIKGGGANFYLKEGEKLVLYLKKWIWSYHTFNSRAESRLAPVLANVNSLKKEMKNGIVVGVFNKESLEDLKVHILQGRHKAPIILDSEIYKDNLVKKERINEFDIAEIPLEPGSYTILIELEGNLYNFNRLVVGYYPYVILEENSSRNWRSINFDLNKIE